jgi:hypothetical protein
MLFAVSLPPSLLCHLRHYASQDTLIFASVFQTHNIGDADHDYAIGRHQHPDRPLPQAHSPIVKMPPPPTPASAPATESSALRWRKHHRCDPRKTMSCIMLFARAQAKLPTKKIASATRRITFRPKISLNREYIGWNAVLVNR